MKYLKHIFVKYFKRGYELYWKSMYNGFRKTYKVDNTFRFNGTNIILYGKGEIIIDRNSYIGSFSVIQSAENCEVKIGKFCSISHNVRMYTRSALPDQDFTIHPLKTKEGNICIGDGVWIGANVFINPGITIGNNSIIGANSVVTKNVPENAIFGGVPAKLIRYKTL